MTYYIMGSNDHIIKQFEKLVDQLKYELDYTKSKQQYFQNSMRLKAVSNVINIIKQYPKQIKAGKDIQHIKGVGQGSVDRINEILKNGYLSEIKKDKQIHKHLKHIEELETVFGVGRKTATKLVLKYNILSVNDLKKSKLKLSNHIKLGLKYYGLYKEQIPREETIQIDKLLQSVAKQVNKNLICQICGSFRRGKSVSSDIDVLLTNKQYNEQELRMFISKLSKLNVIVEDLDNDYKVKYMGFFKLDKKHDIRRIDVMYVDYTSYPTSLLHFTGSWEFNRKMRMIAIELGYTLNQYRLYNNNNKTVISVTSEKDVFDKLGLEYIEPKLR